MILNGKPYTNENGYVDDGLMAHYQQDVVGTVMDWISENISPRKTPLTSHTSYGIKHLLERDTGIYLTNNEFKDAMLQAGYEPIDADALNWCHRISKKSRAFKQKIW